MSHDDEHEHHDHEHHIEIDGVRYEVSRERLTGADLRQLPDPPIASELDLFEVSPERGERKINEDTVVEIKNGLRFITAPRREFRIQIDRVHYEVHQKRMTGTELRHVPSPPIGPERDLFEVVPGQSDRKIEDTTVVDIKNGLRFYTAPAHINPGSGIR